MIITNTTRLGIKHLMISMYNGRNINDQEKIDFAIERVLAALANQEPRTFAIGDDNIDGCIVHVANLHSPICEHVEREGKKYLSCSEDSICVFAGENYSAMIKECLPIMQPNCWGDEEDVIVGTPTYVRATCRDMDGIYDLAY